MESCGCSSEGREREGAVVGIDGRGKVDVGTLLDGVAGREREEVGGGGGEFGREWGRSLRREQRGALVYRGGHPSCCSSVSCAVIEWENGRGGGERESELER